MYFFNKHCITLSNKRRIVNLDNTLRKYLLILERSLESNTNQIKRDYYTIKN